MRNELLTIWQVARELAVTTGTIRSWIGARKIGHVRLGARTIRIPRSELQRLIAIGTVPADGCSGEPPPVVIAGSRMVQ